MSTNIQLSIGDQHLLNENKTRAAANQQALDQRNANRAAAADSQAKAKDIADKSPKIYRPGSLPDNRIKRRPAAQSAAKTEYAFNVFQLFEEENLTLVDDIQKFAYNNGFVKLGGSLVLSSKNITSTVSSYEDLKPYKNDSLSAKYVKADVYKINTYNDIKEIFGISNLVSDSWKLWKVSTVLPSASFSYNPWPYGSINGGKIRRIRFLQSCTENYTYISYVYAQHKYPIISTTFEYYEGPFSTSKIYETYNLLSTEATKYLTAYYHRINNSTKIVETTIVTLASSPFSISSIFSVPYTLTPSDYMSGSEEADFIKNMYQDDPRRIMYEQTSNVYNAINKNLNGCMYNPKTGACYVMGTDTKEYSSGAASYYYSTTAAICKKVLTPNLTYAEALLQYALPVQQYIKTNPANTWDTSATILDFNVLNIYKDSDWPEPALSLPKYDYYTAYMTDDRAFCIYGK